MLIKWLAHGGVDLMDIADVSGRSVAELVSLAGRRAVVTGGARGLGKAIAARLSEAGASVLIGDVRQELAQEAAEDLQKRFGGRALWAQMDVTQPASVSAAAEMAVERLGGVDIWVNNAGIFPSVSLTEMNDETWDQVMAVNLRGVFLGAREAARRMIAAGSGGVIINVVSTAGFKGVAPGLAAYVASKHGVRGVTRWRWNSPRMVSVCSALHPLSALRKAIWRRSRLTRTQMSGATFLPF